MHNSHGILIFFSLLELHTLDLLILPYTHGIVECNFSYSFQDNDLKLAAK